MAEVQEINGGSPGNQQLRPRKSLVEVQETNDCESRKSMAGAQETNGWVPGNQFLVSRKTIAGVHEINGWGPGNQ